MIILASMEAPANQIVSFLAHLEGDEPGQLLSEHLLGVLQGTALRAGKIRAGSAGALVGILHDLGKYSGVFQQYLRTSAALPDAEEREALRGSVDHSTAGAQRIWKSLRGRGTREGVIGEILAICVASHHSGLIDCLAPDGADKLSRRMETPAQRSHEEEAWTNAERIVRKRAENILNDPALIAELSDILARIYRMDPKGAIREFKIGLLVRFLFSCLIDADRTNTADSAKPGRAGLRENGQYAGWPVLANKLEQHLAGFQGTTAINQLRRQVSEECLVAAERGKGIYTLTVPTGGGKTLASLRFALHHAAKWGLDRVIFVSPYTSIIDQNAEVARTILEPIGIPFASVVLEHHSNLTPEKETTRSKILSENWDAPVVFTTAVQVLEALFGSGTRGVRRMHQMARAVLIFDEVHTLPVRCVHLFNNAINFLVEQCGSSVVLCTATQPLLQKVDALKGAIRLGDQAEIMSDVPTLFGRARRYETYDRRTSAGWSHSAAAKLLVGEMRDTGSCLCVVNTKREALSVFRECKALDPAARVFHLSTGMCPAHRSKILEDMKECLTAKTPVICVSTQLIEAGVDISFGSAVRAVAGLDSIAQTAGRCNRHGELESGRVHIVNLEGELPKGLHDIRMAQGAGQRVLDENVTGADRTVDLSDPRLNVEYFRYYFFDRRNEMGYSVGPERAERQDTLLNMLAGNSYAAQATPVQPPAIFLRQAFMSASKAFQAIDANTRGIVVPFGSEGRGMIAQLSAAFELEKQFGLLNKAQRFSVNVFPWQLKALDDAGAVYEAQEGTGILCLQDRFYNEEIGLNGEGTEQMEFQGA